ncbi:MAG: T9SS type A sorting domain-containing protein [Calditrichia bacterium]|nr:T9SS type A sorting domain-containing protein [Calditrichia bacterium]
MFLQTGNICHKLEINFYNLLGQKILVLFSGKQEAGNHSVEFNGVDLPSGIYLYQMKSGEFQNYK